MARPKQETLVLFPDILNITRKFTDAQFGALMRATVKIPTLIAARNCRKCKETLGNRRKRQRIPLILIFILIFILIMEQRMQRQSRPHENVLPLHPLRT